MLIGLRPQFAPNEIDLLFLYQFICEQYKNHTLEEIELAFKKVATGELVDVQDKPIELYDYFTPAFFGKVMTAYRLWASDVGNRIADQKYIEKLKELDYGKPLENIDWREVVESDYQFFANNVDASTTYPEQHYKQLVEDGFIKENFWIKKFKSVKLNLLNDLNRDLVLLQNSTRLESDKTFFAKYHQTKELIGKYKSGERDSDIELIAKQKVIAAFFKYNKEIGSKNIYQRQNV